MKDEKKEILYVAAIYLQKFVTAVADILWLVLLAELIREAVPGNERAGDAEKMAQCVLGLILLSAWKRMGYSIGRSLTLKLQNMVRFRLKRRMVEKTARIPYRLLEDHAFCELVQFLKENMDGGFVWYTMQNSGNFILYCIRILGMGLLLAGVSIPLGILFVLLETGHCLMTKLGIEQEASRVKRGSPEKRYMEELALGQEGAGERTLFSYAGYIAEKYEREAVIDQRAAFARTLECRKTGLANQALVTITDVLVVIALAALLIEGRISIGYFIALSIGVDSLIQKNEEGNALRHLHKERFFMKQGNRFMGLPETEESGENSDRVIQEFETLEFQKVSFRYPRTGRYVLNDLSFRLTKGGYYAFVGVNGSGKSTIVKLLSGLYDTYEGKILLNGMELREIPFQERRRIFAILFQDAAGYEDTIVQNIAPCALTACDEDGHPASVRRQLAEKLVREWEAEGQNRFSQGADTFLGNMEENGVILSRGEWQQLLIARILAQPAQIRILDEPMASLDIFRQSRVYEQFARDAGNDTTLLFSHHMAAVRKAKRIFALREGTIVEEGCHEQLMAEKGLYAELYETQRETRRAGENS